MSGRTLLCLAPCWVYLADNVTHYHFKGNTFSYEIEQWLVGRLQFNATFSTKRLYRALQKLKSVKEFYFI